MKQEKCIIKEVGIFFQELTDLINFRTCFWEEENIMIAIEYCYKALRLLPSHWEVYIDEVGNLVAFNSHIDSNKPVLYLSSHIDVVGAEDQDWITPPFTAVETDDYILGRGANDCIAGTALQLMLARIISDGTMGEYNLGFLIMFREEGNIGKTSSHIDIARLPISKSGTYIITLENTLKINAGGTYTLGIYGREPHNLFINYRGTLSEIRHGADFLSSLEWNPVVLMPEVEQLDKIPVKEVIRNAKSGHTATLNINNNPLLDLIRTLQSPKTLISTGNIKEASVVSEHIVLYEGSDVVIHNLVLNYRGFESIVKIKENLSGVKYKETFGFQNGLGSDQSDQLYSSDILKWFKNLRSELLEIEVTDNPGRSDASAIFNCLSCEQRQYIIPFAAGIGCRTHIDGGGIRHATHGANEGFYKPSAYITIPAFFNLINNFKIS